MSKYRCEKAGYYLQTCTNDSSVETEVPAGEGHFRLIEQCGKAWSKGNKQQALLELQVPAVHN